MNVQFKGGLILIVLVAALYYVFPTFKAYQGGVDPQTVADKVNLGLDLQGGMYLDIEVESDAAVEEIVRRTRDNLEDCLLYTSPSPRDQRGSGLAGGGGKK